MFSAGGADRSIKVWHNPVGVRASVADLKEKLLKAKSDVMKVGAWILYSVSGIRSLRVRFKSSA